MQIEVYRSWRARRQYSRLTPDQKASVQALEALLRMNSEEGFKYIEQEHAGGRKVILRALYGLSLRILYRRKWIIGEIQVIVEDISKSDLPSLTEYEEGEEMRRSRRPFRMGLRWWNSARRKGPPDVEPD